MVNQLRILDGLNDKIKTMEMEHGEIADIFSLGIVKGYPREFPACRSSHS